MSECLLSATQRTLVSNNRMAAPQRLQLSGAKRLSVMPAHSRRVLSVRPLAVAEIAAPDSRSSASSHTEVDSRVTLVHSPQEFEDLKTANKDKLVILVCKATSCRPCKAFQPKYVAAANHYSDSIFAEVFGNESPALRQMMRDMQIKVTPTFVMFRNGEKVHSHGGVNEENFHNAVQEQLLSTEAGYGNIKLVGDAAH